MLYLLYKIVHDFLIYDLITGNFPFPFPFPFPQNKCCFSYTRVINTTNNDSGIES